MSGKLLELSNITKRFPGVVALDGIQFDLEAGKSTVCWEKTEQESPHCLRSSQEYINQMREKLF